MAPTNNAAEHAIRQAVLHRKVKGKLNNWKGMKRLGIMLTYFGTMRKRGLNPSKELVKILTRNNLENLA